MWQFKRKEKELILLKGCFEAVEVGDEVIVENLGTLVHWAHPSISTGGERTYWRVIEILPLRKPALVLQQKRSNNRICFDDDYLDENSERHDEPNFSLPFGIHMRFYLVKR